jgi:hypothetical protein
LHTNLIILFLDILELTKNNKIDKNLFILGDFNIDFNKSGQMMNFLANGYGLFPTFINTNTHDSGSQIDWCFTNVKSNDKSYIRINGI